MINTTFTARLTADASSKTNDFGMAIYIRFAIKGRIKANDENTIYANGVHYVKADSKLVQYLTKGTQIFCVCNDVEARPYTNKQGENVAGLSFNITALELLGRKTEGEQHTETPTEAAVENEDLPF